jgi:hypothetical protein
MGEQSKLLSILHLPKDLQIQIVARLTTEVVKCCLTKVGPYCTKGKFTGHGFIHDVPSDNDETITITHPSILLLRSTSIYFLSLIPLSQELLLQIERHPSTPRTLIGPLRACGVCLRLRPSNEFAIRAHSGPQQSVNSYVEQSFEWWARYRFCRDCGFHAYPDPHPALPPRRQQRRRGTVPIELTTYTPGTKLYFLPDEPNRSGYTTWVWCMDCRILKTYTRSQPNYCNFLCKDCCARLECGVPYDPYIGPKVVYTEHRGYAGIADDVTAEKRRRAYRLNVGAVFVAGGRSLLLKNAEMPYVEKEEEESGGYDGNGEWRSWFDLEGYPTLLRIPASHTGDLPGARPQRRRHLPVAFQVCALFRPPVRRNALLSTDPARRSLGQRDQEQVN